jgi:hypothetical protein
MTMPRFVEFWSNVSQDFEFCAKNVTALPDLTIPKLGSLKIINGIR